MNPLSKKIQPKPISSLDEKHTEMLNYFHEIETTIIPNIQAEIETLKTQIKELDDTQIDLFMDMRDQIKSQKSKIQHLKSLKKNYFLDNSRHIFDYF